LIVAMQSYDHGTFLIVLDCNDLNRAADFWCAALGYDRPDPPSGAYLQLVAEERGGVELLLQRTPDPKVSKNRLHLDLRTPDLGSEVQRLADLGATILTSAPLIEYDWRLARPRRPRRQRVLRPSTTRRVPLAGSNRPSRIADTAVEVWTVHICVRQQPV
jgi:hypothetical protein